MATAQQPLFANTHEDSDRLALRQSIGQQTVNRALEKRLREKVKNYDREAAKLELRGQTDAAEVLRKAADKIRNLMLNAPATQNSGAYAALLSNTEA